MTSSAAAAAAAQAASTPAAAAAAGIGGGSDGEFSESEETFPDIEFFLRQWGRVAIQ